VYDQVIVANEKSASFDRFKMMQGAVRYATHFPIGIGLGNYRAYNRYYGAQGRWGTTGYTSAHGTYSQALAETGLPGLFALLFLFASIGAMLYRCYRRFPPGYSRAYALGSLGGFVGICVASLIGDYMFPAYHNGGSATFGSCVYVFLMIGVVMGMAREEGIAWRGFRAVEAPFAAGTAVQTPRSPAPIYNRGTTAGFPPAAGGRGVSG
jgi:O-antigen ligase